MEIWGIPKIYIIYIYIWFPKIVQNINGQTAGLGYPNLEKHPPIAGELSGMVYESAVYHGLGPFRSLGLIAMNPLILAI